MKLARSQRTYSLRESVMTLQPLDERQFVSEALCMEEFSGILNPCESQEVVYVTHELSVLLCAVSSSSQGNAWKRQKIPQSLNLGLQTSTLT